MPDRVASLLALALAAACGGRPGLQLTMVDNSVRKPSNVAVYFAVDTSDGDPEKISYPSTTSLKLGSDWADKGNEYEPEGATSSGSGSGSTSSPKPTETASTRPSATSSP